MRTATGASSWPRPSSSARPRADGAAARAPLVGAAAASGGAGGADDAAARCGVRRAEAGMRRATQRPCWPQAIGRRWRRRADSAVRARSGSADIAPTALRRRASVEASVARDAPLDRLQLGEDARGERRRRAAAAGVPCTSLNSARRRSTAATGPSLHPNAPGAPRRRRRAPRASADVRRHRGVGCRWRRAGSRRDARERGVGRAARGGRGRGGRRPGGAGGSGGQPRGEALEREAQVLDVVQQRRRSAPVVGLRAAAKSLLSSSVSRRSRANFKRGCSKAAPRRRGARAARGPPRLLLNPRPPRGRPLHWRRAAPCPGLRYLAAARRPPAPRRLRGCIRRSRLPSAIAGESCCACAARAFQAPA